MVGWHQLLNGHEFEQAPRDSEGQGSLGAAVYGVAKSRQDVATEQGQQLLSLRPKSFVFINILEYCSFFRGGSVSLWGFPSKETRMWGTGGRGGAGPWL